MKQVYESKYTDRKITASQKIAEIICERLAVKTSKNLPYRFWNHADWKKFFNLQLLLANKLIKKYDIEVVFKGLRDTYAKNIYSLNAPHLKDILDSYQRTHELFKKQENITTEEIKPEPKVFTGSIISRKKNTLSKLMEIDNDG